jgi:putative aldouronate transport system substrate-binding protein
MKKLFFGMALLALCGAMISCARKQQSTGNDVRLTMLICWNGGFKVPEDQYNNPVAQAIREKTGVTVEFEGIMMSEMEKLNLMFASGDMPDIVNAPFWGGNGGETGVIKKAASEGMLLPIEDILEKYPNVKRSYDIGVISQKYLETDLTDPAFNGHKYLIPQETAGNAVHITNWTYGVFVRGDVPKALGIDEKSIKTSDQLYNFMVKARDYKFKDVNGNDTIVATTYHNGWDYGRYAENFATQKLTSYTRNSDGSLTYDWLTQNWVDQNMFIWRLVNDGILDKECFKTNDTLADQKVGNGTALFFAAQYGVGINATKQTGLYTAHPEMRYIPVGPLYDNTGSPLVQVESMGRTGSPAIFFPSTCKDIEAAFRYIDYVNTPEGMTLAEYGIEGQTFVRNAAGQPRLVPALLERKRNGDATWEDVVREVGGFGYISGRLWYGNLKLDWFGEDGVGAADAAVQEMEDYKKLRPAKQYPGYALSAFENQFPEYSKVSAFAFEGDVEKTWRERAYFAATEAEARRILTDFQTHLKTQENGLFLKFLDFMAEKAKSRSDIAL